MARSKKKLCTAVAGEIFGILMHRRKRRHTEKIKRLWTKPWILQREKYGAYHSLIQELRASDKSCYHNFLRIDEETFNELFRKVAKSFIHTASGGCHFEGHVMHLSHDNKTASDWSVFLYTTKHHQTHQTKMNMSKHHQTVFGDVFLCLLMFSCVC